MSNDVVLTVNACNKDTGFCSLVELTLARAEVQKLQLQPVPGSMGGELSDFSNYKEYWALPFALTLALWLVAKIGGTVLDVIKRAF